MDLLRQDQEYIFQHWEEECSTGNSEARIKEEKASERQREQNLEDRIRCLGTSCSLGQVKVYLAENKEDHNLDQCQ